MLLQFVIPSHPECYKRTQSAKFITSCTSVTSLLKLLYRCFSWLWNQTCACMHGKLSSYGLLRCLYCVMVLFNEASCYRQACCKKGRLLCCLACSAEKGKVCRCGCYPFISLCCHAHRYVLQKQQCSLSLSGNIQSDTQHSTSLICIILHC